MTTAPTLADIERARTEIAPHIERTPLLTPLRLAERLGVDLRVKAEGLQRTGSFKVRGAVNAIAALAPEARARGIVTMSAGNHAVAVAYAARAYGAPVVVAMPETAPRVKVEMTRAYGGRIEFAPDVTRLMPVVEQARERGMTFVHPFDDPLVIAGQGTVGLEIADDAPDLHLVVVPVGGGGLVSGIATAVRARLPSARVVAVEPAGAPKVRRSLDEGRIVRLERVDTIADGCAPPYCGGIAFDVIRELVDDVVLVDDAAIADAMRVVFDAVRVVVEP
ncbi:MAG TPA: pyridoxal-phosphate dependent enzyme, partial [Candidatus Limnocylindria bacterium]|nr:pyridoxal-phosphate dependent enzyme [Candidatus Limnocylindria bacterium]